MDEMGISEKELKLLMNFIKDSGFSNISSSISKTKFKKSREFPDSVILTERRSCRRLFLLCYDFFLNGINIFNVNFPSSCLVVQVPPYFSAVFSIFAIPNPCRKLSAFVVRCFPALSAACPSTQLFSIRMEMKSFTRPAFTSITAVPPGVSRLLLLHCLSRCRTKC